MKIAAVLILALALGGCSLVMPKAGPQLAKAVNAYCAKLSQDERAILRTEVNEAIAPNEACVYCENDVAPRCNRGQ